MERMEQKVCLDTDIAIGILTQDKKLESIILRLKDHEVYLSSITVFELLLRETNLDIAKRFINDLEILPFKEKEAIKASSIFKDLKKTGSLVDMRDIFIAASCISNDCSLLTFNKKHFEKIKELRLLNL